ncbi:MAG: transcription antiterminator [Lachnospiraceae bacterium]|nr:transcription antiterminator [Lachnospiraceae bacterium]
MKDALREVIAVLEQKTRPISFQELANETGFSVRYLRQLLEESRADGEANGFCIEAEFRRGCQIIVTDRALYDKMGRMDDEAVEQAKKVLCFLLDSGDYMRIEDLADRFYTSRATMDRIVRVGRRIAERFELEIMSRQRYGIRIQGNERNKRVCYAYCCNHREAEKEQGQRVQEILYQVLREYRYEVSDRSFHNLVYHIVILLKRLQSGEKIGDEMRLNQYYAQQSEIATELVKRLEREFDVQIPEYETGYLILHLLGKQALSTADEIEPYVYELVGDILQRIYEVRGLDMRRNWDLYVSLCLHIQPMLYRIRCHFVQENPLFYKIKREMIEAYNLAVIAAEVIAQKRGSVIGEQEISYLALHFALALTQEETVQPDMRILVVCGSGRGTSRLLQYKLMTQFGLTEDNITLSSLIQLSAMDVTGYSCVVSTVGIPFPVGIPVIMISPVMDEESGARLEVFLRKKQDDRGRAWDGILREEWLYSGLEYKNRKEILHFLSEQAGEFFESEDTLFDALMKREALSATEVGNQCCMPHPFGIFPSRSVVMIMILKKPVRWYREKVRVVIFGSFTREEEKRELLLDSLARLVSAKASIQNLIEEPTFSRLTACMEKQR